MNTPTKITGTQFYYGSLILTCVAMVVAFCLGIGSLIKQSTCHKIAKPKSQITVVSLAEGCIVIAFIFLYLVMTTMPKTMKIGNNESFINFDQMPAVVSAVFMLVAVGLFAKSSTVGTYLQGQSCTTHKDRQTVKNLDISAAVFSGVSVILLCILIFRPWRN